MVYENTLGMSLEPTLTEAQLLNIVRQQQGETITSSIPQPIQGGMKN